jgi:hypothetical protein
MRLARVVRWVVVLGVLGWVAYIVAGVGWNYFATQEVVDKALRDASARHRAIFSTGTQTNVTTYVDSIRAAILYGALHEGLAIDENEVMVSANQAGLSAAVSWSYPIITYQGDAYIVMPLSIHRSIVIP